MDILMELSYVDISNKNYITFFNFMAEKIEVTKSRF